MIDYLSQYNNLYKYQSGFRTKHSTDLYLSYLMTKILKGYDNGFFTGMILIDLQKTFDAIDHDMLLEKLKVIGFCDDTVNWFHSYLTDRAFLISIESKYSSISKILCGVTPGSVLVPLLFWYASMIWSKLRQKIYYYTLMTVALSFSRNMSLKIDTHLSKDFSNLCEWFLDNKLSNHFGEGKTKSIMLGTKIKLRKAG